MSSIVLTGDTSGTITVSAPAVAGTRTLTLPAATGTAILEDASGVLQMNSGYGSNAAAYGCRAWVNFNGTGTVAIRDSANVSSITDRGTGTYTVNFSTNMPSANYAVSGSAGSGESGLFNLGTPFTTIPQSVSACPVNTCYANGSNYDVVMISVIIFR